MSSPRAPFHRIAIGTDHGGYEMKNRLVKFLEAEGHPVMDCGSYNGDPADYPIYAGRVSRAVSSGLVDAGILLCKSGNGVAMVANRHPGVRAGWAEDEEGAKLAREHNNANALVIGSEHLKGDLLETVRAWLNARHEPASRHGRRVAMVDELDQVHVSALPALRLIQATASPWLASVPPSLADSDDFHAFVARHHLRGATVGRGPLAKEVAENPERWRPALLSWDRSKLDTADVAEALYIGYVRMVADALAETYKRSDGDDGLVAVRIPITPDLKPDAILSETRRLDETLERDNALLSLAAVPNALSAMPQLAKEGESIVLRGMVSPKALSSAIDGWFDGLEERVKNGSRIFHQRLILSVSAVMLRHKLNTSSYNSLITLQLAAMRDVALGKRFHDLALAGASLPRIAWDCEGAQGLEPELARTLFAPLSIQIHDTAFYDLPEGALDGGEHPMKNWLAEEPSKQDLPVGVNALQESAPVELCERENAAGEALADAIKAALKR